MAKKQVKELKFQALIGLEKNHLNQVTHVDLTPRPDQPKFFEKQRKELTELRQHFKEIR
jgi:hypothetical protein